MSLLEGDCDPCIKRRQNLANIRGMDIGKAMQKRIKSGKVDGESLMNYEFDWMKNLECLDRDHTNLNSITVIEANRILDHLEEYASTTAPPPCGDYKRKVLACLEKNTDNSLSCNEDVEAFANCVDDMMYATSRRGYERGSKKPSYTEKFEQLLEN